MLSHRSLAIIAVLSSYLFFQTAGEVRIDRPVPVAQLSPAQIEHKLQECAIVRDLNAYKATTAPIAGSLTTRAFTIFFPGTPAVNAILATLYISGPPTFLLALCPPEIGPSTLSVMVAFAVGGLMGDTLFHLLPEIFLGEAEPDSARFVLLEPNKNLLLGVAIMVGFITFVGMEKALRIATGGDDAHDHSHGHAHAHGHGDLSEKASTGHGSGIESKDTTSLRPRKSGPIQTDAVPTKTNTPSPGAKLGGYLNLIVDFSHNITDGIALSSAFYASSTLGATTTVAVLFHEIPHEIGDFALLVHSGFSKRAAMAAQLVTALGALIGVLVGICIQEFGGSSARASSTATPDRPGICGTSLRWADMLLPFTAGTFLYVGTIAVIPGMLETGPSKRAEVKKILTQLVAIAAGAGIMLAISWS